MRILSSRAAAQLFLSARTKTGRRLRSQVFPHKARDLCRPVIALARGVDMQALSGPRHRHIKKTPLLLQILVERGPAVRRHSLIGVQDIDHIKLQPLGAVHGSQRDGVRLPALLPGLAL